MIHRRAFLIGLGASATGAAALMAAPFAARARSGRETVIRMGALKLIHSIAPYFYERFVPPGYRVEVLPFETPTECKNAVVTRSVDFGMFGIAAAELGAAAGEPIVIIASACNRGMAVIGRAGANLKTLGDLVGKRVAVWPGTTQEVFFLERLHMEGLSAKDMTIVRVSFSEMHIALARSDIDAYVGAEPGPGISVSSGVGELIEYPYSTSMGSLNMVFGAHRNTLDTRPEVVQAMMRIHKDATEFAMSHPDEMVKMAGLKLGQKPDAVAASLPNVDLTWRLDGETVRQAEIYAARMLDLKQIRRLPDFSTMIDTRFVDAISG